MKDEKNNISAFRLLPFKVSVVSYEISDYWWGDGRVGGSAQAAARAAGDSNRDL